VYLICRAGSRSNQAAHALAGAGWDVVNVSDGMTGWAAAGRPMTNESGTTPYVA
jgi:rhodanese-related sulfurtransferase